MNAVLQVFVFTTVIAVSLCATPTQHQAALQLVTKLHKLRKFIRGMAGKFVDTSAIRKGNALLKKRFA